MKNDEQHKIGFYVCHCGSNIADTVNVAEVRDHAATLPCVVISRDYRFMCSDPGQELIKKDIKDLNLDRVVVASCSPLMHEPTFQRACKSAGLNPYLFQMANVREHCSWVHTDKREATDKAKLLVTAAIKRVFFHDALTPKIVKINPATLIVGGGIPGFCNL